MKADLKVHFYLRKTDEKKNGECPVIGKITIGVIGNFVSSKIGKVKST